MHFKIYFIIWCTAFACLFVHEMIRTHKTAYTVNTNNTHSIYIIEQEGSTSLDLR